MSQSVPPFKAPFWLRSPHLQTMYATLFRKPFPIQPRRERFELLDGDFIDGAWVGGDSGPIVVVLHGLEGSIHSVYANSVLHTIESMGWRGLFLHFRNCSDIPNRHDRYYHIGDTGDLMNIMSIIKNRDPHAQMLAVGFSLGGNVLLKWLGEMAEKSPLDAAVAVSVPFNLEIAATLVHQSLTGRLYERYLVRHMKKAIVKKFANREHSPIDLSQLPQYRSFKQFDKHITTKLHGFDSLQAYYEKSSSDQFLPHIKTPTLIVHAKDDPLVPPQAIPPASYFSESTTFECYNHGGHLGFVAAGARPGQVHYWLDDRIAEFLSIHAQTHPAADQAIVRVAEQETTTSSS